MNPEVKDKWIQRLESGEFAQTRGALQQRPAGLGHSTYNPEGFCCLGVLCEIAREEGIVEVKRVNDSGRVVYGEVDSVAENNSAKWNASYLPEVVMHWAGMDSDSGRFRTKDGEREILAHLNDDGATFEQIAQVIKEYF